MDRTRRADRDAMEEVVTRPPPNLQIPPGEILVGEPKFRTAATRLSFAPRRHHLPRHHACGNIFSLSSIIK
jgi:hypothetical protein